MAPETFITYHRDEEALTIIGHLMDGHNKHGHTLNDISFKLQELEETVTGSTTSLSGGSGIEITNDNIINLDFSEFSTDNITEGSTNLFHSDEKVDDRVNNLLQEGSNIVHTYDDVANTFTISTSMDPTFDSVDSAIVFTAVTDVNITRGQVVYISGTAGNGTTPTVDLAIASNAAKMPAFGMARDNASANQTIKIVTFGSLHGITLPNTITFALGDTLYVSSVSAGAYTNVPPGGESNLIQNIGKVQRIGSGSSSVIKVGGAGRTNATSNLNSGNIFYGNSSDQAVTATLTEGNNVTITHDSVNETLTISALGTAVSGNENEVHVINSTGDGFKVSNPLLYMDSGINALIVGYDSANPTEGGSDLNCRQVIAGQTVKSVELYAGSGGAQAGYRSKIGNDIHLGAGIYESTWNGNGSISAFYYDVYNGSRQTNPEIKIARLSNVTKGQIGHHTFQIGPHSTDGSVKFIVDLYNNASNTQGEMARVAIGREPIADTPFTVGSLHVLKTSTTGHQVIIGGSTTNNRYFTFSETGKLGLGNTQDYGSFGQVLTSGGTGAPTWTSLPTITSSTIGLGNVDNTSDRDKPVSTAQQSAIDTKQNKPTASNVNAQNLFLQSTNQDGSATQWAAASSGSSSLPYFILGKAATQQIPDTGGVVDSATILWDNGVEAQSPGAVNYQSNGFFSVGSTGIWHFDITALVGGSTATSQAAKMELLVFVNGVQMYVDEISVYEPGSTTDNILQYKLGLSFLHNFTALHLVETRVRVSYVTNATIQISAHSSVSYCQVSAFKVA